MGDPGVTAEVLRRVYAATSLAPDGRAWVPVIEVVRALVVLDREVRALLAPLPPPPPRG